MSVEVVFPSTPIFSSLKFSKYFSNINAFILLYRIALIERDWMGVPKSASDIWVLHSPIKSIQRIHHFDSTHLRWLCKRLDIDELT